MGIFLGICGCIITVAGSFLSLQRGGVVEHQLFILSILHCPAIAHSNSGQRYIVAEHVLHILHVCSVEVGQVEFFERRAIAEHGFHSRDVGCVEFGDVNLCQVCTSMEHAGH